MSLNIVLLISWLFAMHIFFSAGLHVFLYLIFCLLPILFYKSSIEYVIIIDLLFEGILYNLISELRSISLMLLYISAHKAYDDRSGVRSNSLEFCSIFGISVFGKAKSVR